MKNFSIFSINFRNYYFEKSNGVLGKLMVFLTYLIIATYNPLLLVMILNLKENKFLQVMSLILLILEIQVF